MLLKGHSKANPAAAACVVAVGMVRVYVRIDTGQGATTGAPEKWRARPQQMLYVIYVCVVR